MNSLCDFVSLAEKAMEGSNLIACLYPYDSRTSKYVSRAIETRPQYYILQKKTRKRGRRSRDNEERDPRDFNWLSTTYQNPVKDLS